MFIDTVFRSRKLAVDVVPIDPSDVPSDQSDVPSDSSEPQSDGSEYIPSENEGYDSDESGIPPSEEYDSDEIIPPYESHTEKDTGVHQSIDLDGPVSQPELFPALSNSSLELSVVHLSDDELEEENIMRCVDIKGVYIRRILFSDTGVNGKKKSVPRVYNSYQYCKPCGKKVSNFTQHIFRRHKNVAEIRVAYETEDATNRRDLVTQIRLRYNHWFNLESIKKKQGELFLERRPTEPFAVKDYGPCPHCCAWLAKHLLWKHQVACVGKKPKLTTAALLTQSDVVANRVSDKASKKLRKEVFVKMKRDEVGMTARDDQLIIRLGNMWMEKNVGNPLKRGKYTSQVMRLSASLLLNIRKLDPQPHSLWNYLNQEQFDNIVSATLMTAACTMDDESELEKPSNALKIGFDLKRLINIKIALAIQQKEEEARKSAEDLRTIMDVFWPTRVAKAARVILAERRFNKEIELPDPEDLLRLNQYIKFQLQKLNFEKTEEVYNRVLQLVATKITIYNRRRTGEMEGIT